MTLSESGTTISDSRSVTTRSVALLVVVFDIVQIRYPLGLDSSLLGLVGLVTILCFSDGQAGSLGLKLTPIQGWWYWWRLAFTFGFWIGLALVAYISVWLVLGKELPVIRTCPSIYALTLMCVHAPITEEIIYRVLLIVAVLPTIGRRGSVIASGVIFALIHILRGNASPENQIAGFMLAWAYLKSGTILVPIAMHSGGNLIALGSQVAGWYLTADAG